MTLLSVVGTTAAIIAAIWYFATPNEDHATLDEVRAKLVATSNELKAARDAKAAADRTLSEIQTKLAAEQKWRALAEKAVIDAKGILGNVTLTPSASAATPAGATAKPVEPPKK
ncbi:MAG: hypothetical protein JSS20_16590 [Proteobacteria bacterium]|nr:hypothetical protein [Pseudomonadota bacterium]